MNWFGRRALSWRRAARSFRGRRRSPSRGSNWPSSRPSTKLYLGQTAYLTLVLFENLGRAVTAAPTTEAKTSLSRGGGRDARGPRGLIERARARHDDPVAEMEPFSAALDDFRRRTQGADWPEILVTCYLTAGFLTDFFTGLAAGLPPALSRPGQSRSWT